MSPEEIMNDLSKYTGNTTGPSMEAIVISHNAILDFGNMISGFFAYLVVIGMFIISAFDMMYINLPSFRDTVIQKRWDSSRDVGGRQFVSSDARNAVVDALNTGKNANALYLKYRIKSYVIAATLVFILLTGTSTITNVILRIVLGFFNVFGVAVKLIA